MSRVLTYSSTQQGHWTLSKWLRPGVAGTLALILALGLAILVLINPVTLHFHIGFALPIFLCAWTRNRAFLWSVALAALGLTIGKIIWGEPPPLPYNRALFLANRAIAIVTLVACAGVAHLLIGLIDAIRLRSGELEAHNAELAAREEKIAQQNAEFQQQAEALARQGDALRASNETLLAREASIEHERERLKTLLATVPVGVAIADVAAQTIVYNAAAASMLGVEADVQNPLEPMVSRFASAEVGFEPDRNRHGIVRALAGESVSGLERDFSFPDGRRLVVLVSAAPLRDRAGAIVGAVAGFVDITEQKQMQAELDAQRREAQESSARKSRFLAAVSHDIRTPANAISLLAELLQRSSTSPTLAAEIPEIARDLKTSALSLVRLVSDVLDLTRFDSARVDLVETEFPLAQMMHDESRQFLQQARDKGVSFNCEAPGGEIMIRADRVKLARVLSNLIGNAVKFTREGSITLDGARQPDGSVQIRITDTGPGIPPEHHERIFDEYFQLKNPQREQEKGSGLGLAICRRLAQAMGASLTVNSDAGKGATFTVTLPAATVVKG